MESYLNYALLLTTLPNLSLPLSLSLSPSLSLSHSLPLSFSHSLTLSLSHSLTLSRSLARSHTLSHTLGHLQDFAGLVTDQAWLLDSLTISLSRSITLSLSHPLTLSLSRALTLAHFHARSHTLSHSLGHPQDFAELVADQEWLLDHFYNLDQQVMSLTPTGFEPQPNKFFFVCEYTW